MIAPVLFEGVIFFKLFLIQFDLNSLILAADHRNLDLRRAQSNTMLVSCFRVMLVFLSSTHQIVVVCETEFTENSTVLPVCIGNVSKSLTHDVSGQCIEECC